MKQDASAALPPNKSANAVEIMTWNSGQMTAFLSQEMSHRLWRDVASSIDEVLVMPQQAAGIKVAAGCAQSKGQVGCWDLRMTWARCFWNCQMGSSRWLRRPMA